MNLPMARAEQGAGDRPLASKMAISEELFRLSRFGACVGLLAAVAGGACAHGATPTQLESDELARTVASLRVQNASYVKRIEDLENQVFILTDQADTKSTKAQRMREPALPTVRLHPSEQQDEASAGALDDPNVEYVGDAAHSNVKRPLLRLVGNERGEAIVQTAPDHPIRPIFVADERNGERLRTSGPRLADSNAVELYKHALDALQAGDHGSAAAGFRDFLRFHPAHDYADNAQYWLAECYYDLKDFATASREFHRVVERYPQGNKVPDALLKQGFAQLALGQQEAAKLILSQLARTYPRHPAGAHAQAKLDELKTTAGMATSAGQ